MIGIAVGLPAGPDATGATRLDHWGGTYGVLQAGGLLFFAFAGYARIATMGEEVRDPRRRIPRAIPVALAITVVVYLVVAVAALPAPGPEHLAAAPAPLIAAVQAVGADALVLGLTGRWAVLARRNSTARP